MYESKYNNDLQEAFEAGYRRALSEGGPPPGGTEAQSTPKATHWVGMDNKKNPLPTSPHTGIEDLDDFEMMLLWVWIYLSINSGEINRE